MKISVAMATYNGAKYLEEQLASFATQTLLPDELVVTDDCSNDNTLAILGRFASTAPFKVFYKQNERKYGYAGNFNEALKLTSGDLVFLSDQDDHWFPDKIERIAKAAEENSDAWVLLNDAELTDEKLKRTGITKLGQIRSAGFDDASFVMGCCAAIRRELLDICMPIPNGFPSHDNWVVGIAEMMDRKIILPHILQYYRRHGSNESRWIVNRTTAVTRWDVELSNWVNYGKQLFKRNSRNERLGDQIDGLLAQHQAFVTWVEIALESSPKKYLQELQACAVKIKEIGKELEKSQKGYAKRSAARNEPFFQRLISVLKLLGGGEYKQFSGVKSALRDFFVR